MAVHLLDTQYDADSYQKYRFPPSENLQSVIFSYLEEKKVDPVRLAVDVGCGSGQSTHVLAAHFEKVVGTDISEAQIEAAKQAASFPNVTYHVCPAEELPFEDGSVDLITAFTAAHWFDMPRFMKEVDRVLKPHGCVALSTYTTDFSMHYKDCSERLTEIFTETRDLLLKYSDEKVNLVIAEYKEVFESVPFPDKKRVTQILDKIPMSVSGVIGLFQSFSMYQAFLRSDPEAAKSLLQKTEQRFLETMGVCSNETQAGFPQAVERIQLIHQLQHEFLLPGQQIHLFQVSVIYTYTRCQFAGTWLCVCSRHKIMQFPIRNTDSLPLKTSKVSSSLTWKKSVCPAEELPFADGSVDLITAFTAAHWFDMPRFMKEVDRVLKPHRCVALSTYTADFSMHYKDCSERLTEIFTETHDQLLKYADEKVNLVIAEYKEVFESMPFPDTKRVTQIFDKIPMSVSGVIGLFQSFSMYQAFLRSDPEAAKSLLQKTEQRFLETMGVCSNETQVEIGIRSACVLGCKGP
uniref:Methyltransferase type 11 domain-containing protein n=1 Tax=Chrysemys picta bellii TaxID=8478 RepID=A0A8C3FCP2_CHRPI